MMLTADSTLAEVRAAIAAARSGAPLIVTTSGSTAEPKRVALDYAALLASAEASAERIGSGNWYLALPAGYIAGVNVVLRAELAGGQLLAIAEAPNFAAAAAALPAPRFTSVVPAQLAKLAALAESGNAAEREEAAAEWCGLADFDCVLVGGQALPRQLREVAENHGVRIVTSYGASETSGGCVYNGEPLAGVQLSLDEDGVLLISAPMLASGYVDAAGAIDQGRTAESFVERDGQRWYRSNDLAELRTSEGGMTVRVLGRSDHTLISGGVKLDLNEVQIALDDWLGAESALALAIPSERWGQRLGVCRLDSGMGAPAALGDRALAERLERQFGLAARRPVIASAGCSRFELPSGKPDLASYRELVLAQAGEGDAIGTMNDDEQKN